MTRIALAGGSGGLGREVLDVLVSRGKHEITVLSRRDEMIITKLQLLQPNTITAVVDYQSLESLISALQGIDTVLSFILDDKNGTTQKRLIDACVRAGVKRFAPSEWAWYTGANPTFTYKQAVYKYLQELNTPKQQLEYTLFRPGWFSNYLTYPQSSCKYFHQTCLWIDVSTCQALVIRGLDPWICLTSVQDTAAVVAQAVEDTRTWPTQGGIVGVRLKQRDIIRRAEIARGKQFQIYELDEKDLQNGLVKSPWIPRTHHPSIPPERLEEFSKSMVCLFLLAAARGEVDVDSTWNQRLPEFQFSDLVAFLKLWFSQ